ncbi:MAG: hypothetical protein J7498_00955 [Sphingobium sp.]|nr:hypothetical protein [Sphingobium sp.]
MQTPLADWPAGLCREIAAIETASIMACLGQRLTFEKDRDDLDAFSAAIFTIDDTRFALQLYDRVPTGNFTLIVSDDAFDDQARLNTFLNWSGVPESAVVWRLLEGRE